MWKRTSKIEQAFAMFYGPKREKLRRASVFTLLELVFVLAIAVFLFAKLIKLNFQGPVKNKAVEAQLTEQGIDVSNPNAMIKTTKIKVEDINRQILQRQKEAEEQTP